MSGPWIQQKNLYVPGFVNVTREARGSPIGRRRRQRRDEEAVAVLRFRRRRSRRFGSDAERQERRRPGSAGPALRGQVGLLLELLDVLLRPEDEVVHLARRLVHEASRSCPAFTAELASGSTPNSVVFLADAHADRVRRRLGDARQRLRLRPAGVLLGSACAFTWSGSSARPRPRGLTTTVAFMPGWSVQTSLNVPAFGNVYVHVAGFAFGPCGRQAAARRRASSRDRLRPEGPERRPVVDQLRQPVEVERLARRVDDALVLGLLRVGHEERRLGSACTSPCGRSRSRT